MFHYINTLPIYLNAWLDKDIYVFFTMLTECGKNIEYNGETLFFTYFKPLELISIENVNSRVLRGTIRKLQCARKTVGNDYICAMPMHIWVRFVSALNAVPFSRRKAIARVYIYLYYHAMSFFGSFGRSRELMITDLRVNNHTLNDALKWLIEREFIIATDYSMRANDRYTRRYYIPEEDWTFACRHKNTNINLQH